MSISKQVNVVLLGDEDIPECFKILSQSFGHDAPFVDAYFPNHDTLSGQIQGSNRLLTWKHTSDESTFLKAVTSINGSERIIGLAIWTYMKDIPPQKLEDAEVVEEIWPDINDRKFVSGLWEDYVKPRTRTIKESNGRGVYVLELLAIHPSYQKLGAGTRLVTWGTQASDKLQVKAIVEGTPAGRRVYEKCGFVAEIDEMRFDPGEEFSERPKPKLAFMVREPVS
ncbi:hypothetical protein F4860DRAFT_477876 [Xylaria cubensis]|nr:hypothetical protein F4860DRAFT_477876 [Xylaria cubensis]